MEKNLTTGSVFKTILYFALPYLFSYFLQTLYGMADLFIIGQFNGTESTTAVANGSQVMHMLTVMIVGLAMGSTVIIGRAVGARHKDEIAKNSWELRNLIHGTFHHIDDCSVAACKTDRVTDSDTGRSNRGFDPVPDNLLYRNSVYYSL